MSDAVDDLDLESRRLCPNGACIGIIGEDGRCKVCGLADDGSVVAPATREMDVPDHAAAAAAVAAGEDPFDGEERELCPDGACIGVLGPDGKCKECGRVRGS